MKFGHRKISVIFIFLAVVVFLVYLAVQTAAQQNSGDVDLSKLVMPVVAVKVRRQTVAEKIDWVGTLRARNFENIKSEINGVIKKVNFVSGQKVKKGDALVVFDQAEARAVLLKAKADVLLARLTLDRYKGLLKGGGVSRLDFDQASSRLAVARAEVDAAKARFRGTVVDAPFDGTMGQRLINAGQFIARGDSLGTLVNQSSVEADFYVSEKYLNQIKRGQAIQIRSEAYPGEHFQGKVVFIAPTVDRATRTVLVAAAVPNPGCRLRQGMFVDVVMKLNQKTGALVVPQNAVVLNGSKTIVYTVRPDNTVAVVPVRCGLWTDDSVEILKGLKAGQTVITEGYQKVHSGSRVELRGLPVQAPPGARGPGSPRSGLSLADRHKGIPTGTPSGPPSEDGGVPASG